ncbi:MAG: site-specific integrase, partial [Nitrospiraceae bacterium]
STSTMSPKTRFSHAQAVNMFLTWGKEQAYPVPSQYKGILKPYLAKPKEPAREKAFTGEELKLIFGTEQYRKGAFTRPSDYWVPLLGLLTGAREAELCQLHHADIYQDQKTNLWVIDFNDKAGKNLKTPASRRKVPIHPTVITLGLMEYLENARTRSNTRLFPDEAVNDRGEYGAFSKRFNRYKTNLGIRTSKDQKKDFHSLRHALIEHLVSKGVEEYIMNAIVGHSQATRTMTVSKYGGKGTEDLLTLNKAILKIYWDLDFTKIKPNGWIEQT